MPVLIGTRSVKASVEASEALQRLHVPHRVLNAVDEQAESDIVAGAGEAGRVTVATNMAGEAPTSPSVRGSPNAADFMSS